MALTKRSSVKEEKNGNIDGIWKEENASFSNDCGRDDDPFAGMNEADDLKHLESDIRNGLSESVSDENKEIEDIEHGKLEKDMQEVQQKLEEISQMTQKGFEGFQERLITLENKVEAVYQDKEKDGNDEIISNLSKQIETIAKNQDRNDRQITQTLRENANFQIQVRQGMQKELDTYKKIDSKEVFVPVLETLASVYIEYQTIFQKKMKNSLEVALDSGFDAAEEIKEKWESMSKDMEEMKKSLEFLLDDIKEILEDNGAEIIQSKVGEKRKARLCKIMQKIPTADREKHNTIAKSIREGVVLGRQILCNEYVDVYVYDENLSKEDNALEADKIQDEKAEVEQEMINDTEQSGVEEEKAEAFDSSEEEIIDGSLRN